MYHSLRRPLSIVLLALLTTASAAFGQIGRMVDAGEPYGKLKLVDEIDCTADLPEGAFGQTHPGASRVIDALGQRCRELPVQETSSYLAYLVGKGKGLVAGRTYVLAIDYPEDKPRTVHILNRGAEFSRGFRTGAALGDCLYGYTNNNAESIDIPLAKAYRTWHQWFNLHERYSGMRLAKEAGRPMTPEQGFWVIITQPNRADAPVSEGLAISRIRLFEVTNPKQHWMKLNLPPKGLPQRYLFMREEMADGAVQSPDAKDRAFENDIDWYEAKSQLYKFLGMNAFGKDLLEFGHNQGWDSLKYGTKWMNAAQPHHRDRWPRILAMLKKYDLAVMPMYEYRGSVGPESVGSRKLAVPLRGSGQFSHIGWLEKTYADITEPDTLEDAKRVLELTMKVHRNDAKWVGAWFRARPSAFPMSFSDNALAKFADQANGGQVVTREQLQKDTALYQKYKGWWFDQRKAFLIALRDYVRQNVDPDAVILFTTDSSEPGYSLQGGRMVVTDETTRAMWEKIAERPEHKGKIKLADYDQVVAGNKHLEAMLAPNWTWGEWEWQHSVPEPDPENYADTEGVMLTYTFNRAYTVSNPHAFDPFHTPSGLAVAQHYPLNENRVAKEQVGYYVCDVERTGPYIMLAEARAMAYGNPRYIAYLSGSSYNSGFPEYTRRFNAAFLSLPALPAETIDGASGHRDVVVRKIDAGAQGVYLAIINVGLADVQTTIQLPRAGKVTDAATGKAIAADGQSVKLSMYPCELRALRIR